jgi:rhodanese-related sulfurtransferase
MRQMTAGELHGYLQTHSPTLIDVREPWEFEHCRIPGSRSIPMRQIPQAVAGLDPDQEIVLICHHGIRSLQVAYFLEHAGFAKLINLRGGVAAWAEEVDPAMPVY